jgi:hypothetical protein
MMMWVGALVHRFCQISRQPIIWRPVGDLVRLAGGEVDRMTWINCVGCGSSSVTEPWEVTAQGYRRFRCRDCGRPFNERSGGMLNRTCLPSDIISFVIFCRLRYRLTLQDLSEILLLRGFTVIR